MHKSKLALVKRELASLRSEKTILVAIAVQCLVASFSSVLVVGVVTMYNPQGTGAAYTLDYGVVGPDAGAVDDAISERTDANLATYLEYDDALDAYHKRHIDAILHVSRDDAGQLHVRLIAPEEGFTKTAVVSKTKDILKAVEERERSNAAPRLETQPLPLPDGGEPAPYAKFTYTVLLPVLMFLPAFISGSLVSDSLLEGRTRGTLDILRSSPLSDADIFDAKALTMAALAPAQAFIWAGFLSLNSVPLHNLPLLMVAITGVSLLVATVGAATAFYFTTRAQSQFAYALASMGVFTVLYALPEHPVNTIAKLALDNPSEMTYGMVGVFAVAGVVAYWMARRRVVSRGLTRTR